MAPPRITLCCLSVLLMAAATQGFTTDMIGTDEMESSTPSPGTPSPGPGSTATPGPSVTEAQGGDPLSRTDKIIIGVTCGVVGAAAIGGLTSALVNKRKARLQIEAEDKKKLQENNA